LKTAEGLLVIIEAKSLIWLDVQVLGVYTTTSATCGWVRGPPGGSLDKVESVPWSSSTM
jgi:hypothetical protein